MSSQEQQNKIMLREVKTGLDKERDRLTKLLSGDPEGAERLIASALMEVSQSPDLMACDARSVTRCVVQCAVQGFNLSAGLGEAWMIPFNARGHTKKQATLMVGYKGWRHRSQEEGFEIVSDVVYEKDAFSFVKSPPKIHHAPCLDDDRGAIRGAYAVAYRIGDMTTAYKVEWAPNGELEKARALAKKRNYDKESPAWMNWPDRMRLRLPIGRICRELPYSSDGKLAKLVQMATDIENGKVKDLDFDDPLVVDGGKPDFQDISDPGEGASSFRSGGFRGENAAAEESSPPEGSEVDPNEPQGDGLSEAQKAEWDDVGPAPMGDTSEGKEEPGSDG